jgi:LysR family transcriptional regulator, carnitine catabolism transcriptional activator
MEFTSRELRAFHLVAQHRSFARAAEGSSDNTFGSQCVNTGVGTPTRIPRQVALTAQGSDLLAVTQSGLMTLDAAMLPIAQATPWIAANVLPEAIRQFREHRPDLHVRLFDGGLGGILRRVQGGKLDFGVGL